jgi:PAS domain S-box-containing protein
MTGGDFRRVFETAHESQLLLDSSALLVTASYGYLRAIGRTCEEVVGRSIFELPPCAGAPAASASLRDALSSMQRAGLPLSPVRLADETARQPRLWSQATLRSIRDAGGHVVNIVLALQLTSGGIERSESDSERRLRKLIERTYDAIALFDEVGRVAYVSPTVRRVLGFSEQEFMALDSVQIIHPDDQAYFGEHLARMIADPNGMMLLRFRVRHRDGHWVMVENAAINRLDDPDVAAVVATFRDVSKQVELNEALRLSSERLRIALDAARAISWDGDLIAGRTTFSSDFAAFFDVSPGENYEDPERALLAVHPDDRARVRAASLRCRQEGVAFDVVYRNASPAGETRWFASHGQLARDSGGEPVRMLGVTWDITERQRLLDERRLLEQRMQESQKLESLGVLAGGIAHDFNNLLMVILGSISLLRLDLGGSHPSVSHVAQMEEASQRATDLCRQLLAYAGKGRFVMERTDLNRLIDDTLHLLQVSISKKAALRFQLDRELPAIVADTTQLRQVLMNLVMNASDAIGERSGAISISTGVLHADRAYLDATFLAPDIPTGEYVFLEVSDTGSGMSAETQARIFEPFFTTKFTGRGLGLAAVLGIVRGHRGALKVHSELGRGASFKFLLPSVSGVPEPTTIRPPREPVVASGGTILVVDDEAAVRDVARLLLESLGFQTLLASDGIEALAVYGKHRAQIVSVLMDLTMPTLDGEETFRELRRIDPGVRVLLMSGYNEQDAIARFVGKGVAGFIQKPFTLADLTQRLRALGL